MSLMRALSLAGMLFVLAFTTGCGSLVGNLRRDLDDTPPYEEPTVGGRWVERGFLSESMPERGGYDRAVDRGERGIASARSRANDTGNDWISEEREAANRRDRMRSDDDGENSPPSYNDHPNMVPATKRLYKNGARATRADFVDESTNEGSLWASDGQTNYYFTKNKVRGVGDIVTVNIEQDLIRDMGNEVKRGLNEHEREAEMILAEERAKARAMGVDPDKKGKSDAVSTSQAAPTQSGTKKEGEASAEPKVDVLPSDVDVAKSLEVKAGDTIMAEIVERYPNGNYKIRGTKRVLYKNGAPRMVNLVGVVKSSDISEDDVVNSGKLYEYRLEAIR